VSNAQDAMTIVGNTITSKLGLFVYPKGDQDASA